MKASKLDILINVGLPRTMPYFFASLKVAVTLAFVGTVIAETVASNRGIGNLMMIASSSFDVPLVFAGLLILAVLGVGLYVVLMCIFPIVVNVATGLATTEPELEDVMRALKASKLDILINVGLPRTMPYFFASLKVAVTLAFVGTVIAETVASNRGIGNLMMIASSSFDVPLVFAGLLILAVMGVGLYVIFSFIEVRVTGWALRKNEFAMG